MNNRLSSRLARLLNLVPFFIANPGMSAAEAAAELGVSTTQLMNDLNQLWVCGLPGYGPGDLIDLSFSEESIDVTFSAGIDRPLRLTSTEATALLIALRSLVEMPGMVDPSAAQRAIAKIEAAAGSAAARATGNGQEAEPEVDIAEDPVTATVRAALANRRALKLTYYSASRDAVSERVVDPVRIVLVDNFSYLQGWCRQAEGVRLFRFDRIDAAIELDEPSNPPPHALDEDSSLELFSGDGSLPEARLFVAQNCVWMLDYYPMDVQKVNDDGSVEATMSFGTLEWMARLVLGFGEGVRVLGPPELVAEVHNRAVTALDAYDTIGS
ncbi:YafY family transcriptional regulator [Rhodococcus sp. KBS0724]|jgi:proteasome accessory factor C|uniref:helix-turn-helix transcriptional regulator n=1 Tax=Rhodococcus sp. KBS0724 TaxID=1179674 RepID=UPI00110E987C|nr:YafY family protein [Rhodococcus sp. KBS0724]TSD47445.1 YafY family transcriptional regulator [Rhodococcus sp. KBS0724]